MIATGCGYSECLVRWYVLVIGKNAANSASSAAHHTVRFILFRVSGQGVQDFPRLGQHL